MTAARTPAAALTRYKKVVKVTRLNGKTIALKREPLHQLEDTVKATARALVCLACVLAAASAHAQSTTGSISGTVLDQSKAILPGATVSVTNVETAATRSIATDADGRYRALNLTPGRYSVVGELSGFTKTTINNVLVQIGRDIPIDLMLSVGGVSENVTVAGETALLDLSTAVVGGVARCSPASP